MCYRRNLENLIRNSVEAISYEGQVEVPFQCERDKPVLVVRDNGCGIPFEIQNKIFDFDFTTKSCRGTGLGLGIVKKLCNLYGAEVTFNSSVGEGPEFIVSFRSFFQVSRNAALQERIDA